MSLGVLLVGLLLDGSLNALASFRRKGCVWSFRKSTLFLTINQVTHDLLDKKELFPIPGA
jgi:hypothetical protein